MDGKTSEYNFNEWNNIELFNKPDQLKLFVEYSIQDSISLLNAILNARSIYHNNYNVDIVKVVSTPSLSLLIYRHKFQQVEIPILNRKLDSKIRDSYFGGSSDYFKLYGENLYYYDINSLYPYAMLNDMPLNFLGEHIVNNSNREQFKLENIFGFIECDVECPTNIKYPLLIHNVNGKIVHPTGRWSGTYFSEELKAVCKYGYKIKINKVYLFSRENLFNDYIDHFYEKKKNSVGAERFIAKLHLNSLYGMFGRKLDMLKTVPATPYNYMDLIQKYPIKNVIDINDKFKLLLTYNNLDFSVIKKINEDLDLNMLKNGQTLVKSNVSIASAITSYARIKMMQYKVINDINIYYTDTDSIFVDKQLPINLIGKELGLMKDELDGGIIAQAYLFGIKNLW